MEKEKINQVIGWLLFEEKYKFIQEGLLGEIVRDFVKGYEKIKE